MIHTLFSVAMSVYSKDSPIFFDSALNSITGSQTIMPDEIVLIVDGPVDDEINKVIEKYTAKYDLFNVIRLDNNGGLGNALRIAIDNCRCGLVARMDSDDVAVENRFEQQLQYYLQYPKIDIVGGDITEFIDTEDNIVGKRKVPKTDAEIKQFIKKRCPFNHVTVMYKKSAVLGAGNYQDWFWNEDYYLWIRMFQNNAIFANTGTVLINVRTSKDMYQRRGGGKYFVSEIGLQKYMLKHKIIGIARYITNCLERYVVQMLLSNRLRCWVFQKFARMKD